MRFPNGLRSHLFTSRLNPYRERRLTVVGTKAMAVFDDVEPWERKLAVYRHAVWQDSGQWAFTANEPSYMPVEEGMPLTRELEHFLTCIETRAEPLTSGEEAIEVLKILTAGTVIHPQQIQFLRDRLETLLRRSPDGVFFASGVHGPKCPLRSGSRNHHHMARQSKFRKSL